MLKAVIDTSVFVAGLIKDATCRRVIKSMQASHFTPVVSSLMLEELFEVIARKKFHRVIDRSLASLLIDVLKTQALLVTPTQRIRAVKDDPDDNCFIEAAVEAHAHCIVSVDNHLLALGSYKNIVMIRPSPFLELLKK